MEGARLIAPIRAWLGEWGNVVEQHHERCAGSHFDPAIVTAFIDHRPAPAMHLAA